MYWARGCQKKSRSWCDRTEQLAGLRVRSCNGFLRRVPSRREFSSVRRFECVCAEESFPVRRICFDFRFLLPRRIGWKARKTSATGFWMLWDDRFVSRENMGTTASPEWCAMDEKPITHLWPKRKKPGRTVRAFSSKLPYVLVLDIGAARNGTRSF